MDADGPQLVFARQGEGQSAVLDQGQPFTIGVVDGVQGLNAGQLVLNVARQGRGGDLPDVDGLGGRTASEIEFAIHDDPLACG